MKRTKIGAAAVLLLALLPCAQAAAEVHIYEPQYARIEDVNDNTVIAGTLDALGVYTLDGETIIPREYTGIQYSDGYYLLRTASGYGVAAPSGEVLLQPAYTAITIDAARQVAFVQDAQQGSPRYGLFSLQTRTWPLPLTECEHGIYASHMAYLQGKGLYASDGTELPDHGLGADAILSENAFRFAEQGKCGVVDLQNSIIVPAQYTQIEPRVYVDGFLVRDGDKWGLLAADGTIVTTPAYDGYEEQEQGLLFYLRQGEKKSYYTTAGVCILTGADGLIDWCGEAIEFQKNGKYGVVDRNGREILPFVYDSDSSINQHQQLMLLHRAAAQPGQAFGRGAAVSARGEVLLPEDRYDLLRFDFSGSETIWCYTDDTLRAIYDAQGRKIAVPQGSEPTGYMDGMELFWIGPALYTADGDCILQADALAFSRHTKRLVSVQRNGRWQIASLTPYGTSPSAWAKTELDKADKAGIVPDYLKISWDTPITREDFCVVLTRALQRAGQDVGADANVRPFSDIRSDAVDAAYRLGIVEGIGGGRFAPDRSITREEAAKMLWNAAKLLEYEPQNTVSYVDEANISLWAREAVANISAVPTSTLPILQGTGAGRFSPQESYTREQAVASIYRLLVG